MSGATGEAWAGQLAAWDRAHVWHPFTQMRAWCDPAHDPVVLVEGEGAFVRDSRGRRYLDGNASIWTNIHGHRHPHIVAAIAAQLERIEHASFLGTSNEPAIVLAARLCTLVAGTGLTRVFYSDDGSTAVEVAIKMALQYWQLVGSPERDRFVAFDLAYHGDTAGAGSLGGLGAFVDRFAAVHFQPVRVSGVAALDALDGALRRRVAAVVIEPGVRGAAGIRPWPHGVLRSLRAWCDACGALLIFDEVLTGFGRTGRMFAFEHEGVAPDFLCLAKGLSGGFLPLAATLTTEKVFEAFLGDHRKTFFYGHSYCGNPLACAAALASLDVFEHEHTIAGLPSKIAALRAGLDRLAARPHVAEVRQCGLIAGIELQRAPAQPLDSLDQTGARVCMAARRHGLLTRPILDTIVLIPPLCISEAQLDDAVAAIERAIHEILAASANTR